MHLSRCLFKNYTMVATHKTSTWRGAWRHGTVPTTATADTDMPPTGSTTCRMSRTYVDSRGKGYKEDFVREELEAAIELYEENKEEDK